MLSFWGIGWYPLCFFVGQFIVFRGVAVVQCVYVKCEKHYKVLYRTIKVNECSVIADHFSPALPALFTQCQDSHVCSVCSLNLNPRTSEIKVYSEHVPALTILLWALFLCVGRCAFLVWIAHKGMVSYTVLLRGRSAEYVCFMMKCFSFWSGSNLLHCVTGCDLGGGKRWALVRTMHHIQPLILLEN